MIDIWSSNFVPLSIPFLCTFIYFLWLAWCVVNGISNISVRIDPGRGEEATMPKLFSLACWSPNLRRDQPYSCHCWFKTWGAALNWTVQGSRQGSLWPGRSVHRRNNKAILDSETIQNLKQCCNQNSRNIRKASNGGLLQNGMEKTYEGWLQHQRCKTQCSTCSSQKSKSR